MTSGRWPQSWKSMPRSRPARVEAPGGKASKQVVGPHDASAPGTRTARGREASAVGGRSFRSQRRRSSGRPPDSCAEAGPSRPPCSAAALGSVDLGREGHAATLLGVGHRGDDRTGRLVGPAGLLLFAGNLRRRGRLLRLGHGSSLSLATGSAADSGSGWPLAASLRGRRMQGGTSDDPSQADPDNGADRPRETSRPPGQAATAGQPRRVPPGTRTEDAGGRGGGDAKLGRDDFGHDHGAGRRRRRRGRLLVFDEGAQDGVGGRRGLGREDRQLQLDDLDPRPGTSPGGPRRRP